MLATIKSLNGIYTLRRADGKEVTGYIDQEDNVEVIENSLGCEDETASYILGLAIVHREMGNDVIVWRRLRDQVQDAKKYVNNYIMSVN
jgi:hypothetical protein